MATVTVDERGLTVRLGRWERLGGFHGDVTVPVSGLVRAMAVADVWEHLRGVRAPGTGWPGLIMLGTTRRQGLKDFCVVYRHGPGLVVDLRDHEFARLVISLPLGEATAVASLINQVTASPGSSNTAPVAEA